jgi:hypothetical protein
MQCCIERHQFDEAPAPGNQPLSRSGDSALAPGLMQADFV